MIAHLGMYGSRVLNDTFWQTIRARLGFGPTRLTHSDAVWDIWQSPDLLFSQTCGYPYRAHLHGRVHLIGTPDYAVSGCPPGYYNSVIVARADDPHNTLAEFDGADFAFNEALSQSGWAAPIQHMLDIGTAPGRVMQSGAHAASLDMVANGSADFAGIDAVTFDMVKALKPYENLKVIARTEPTPGLPYVTALGNDPEALFRAVDQAIADLEGETRTALQLGPLQRVAPDAYLSVPTPPSPQDIAPIVSG